jgi:hypothetical protein
MLRAAASSAAAASTKASWLLTTPASLRRLPMSEAVAPCGISIWTWPVPSPA